MRLWKNPFLLVGILSWLIFSFLSVVSSEILSGSGVVTDVIPDPNPAWQVLTRKDFPSQIRLHSHILLLVTVPWCGESRSLMREIKHLVSAEREEFGHLKLFVVYRNSEKILADILGATEGTKIIYYQNSIQLKYNGRLRALNILSSISHAMSIQDDEIPLKHISEFNEKIESYLDLTEKSVLLIDLCGWSAQLAPKRTNGSYDASSNKVASGVLVKEAYKTVELSNTKDKIIEDEEIAYRGYAASSAMELGFTLANQSVPEETQNGEFYNKPTCTIEEFQKFQSFYKEFISLAKEHFLPPERQRFSLVSSKSLLPYLGVENVENWSVLVRFSGCPNCSIMLRDGDELRSVLLDHHPLVKELDTEALLPSNRPSLVLFIDTSAESSETRSESKSALEVIRKYAGQNYKLLVPSRVSSSKRTGSRDASGSNVMSIKDKMVMVVNEGLNEGNNNRLVDILTKLLQQTKANRQKSKGKKISVLAKELGFQLLSQDFDVKAVKPTLEDKSDSQSDDVTSDEKEINVPFEDLKANSEEETMPKSDIHGENEFEKNFEMGVEIKKRKEQILLEMKQEKTTSDKKLEYISEIEEIVSISSMQSHEVKKELSDDNTGFVGSIFFADGSYQLLSSLTSGSRIPTLIIIDPTKQQHFVFDEETLICYSSLANFLDRFLNQSLPPFIRSDPLVGGTKEFPRPPFVNQDFHEAVSVPRISANGFCESVMGYKDCLVIDKDIDLGNVKGAWSRDVLVLFSNSWCGFCQRMELVLREVYRAFDSFMTVSRERDANIIENQDKSEMSPTDLPLTYLMDCTRNDCYPFLRASGKEERYPTLLLFPAETKKSISFDSAMSVINIFEFLDAHSKNFKNYRGTLWTQPRETIQDKSELQDISSAIEEHRISQFDLETGVPTVKSGNKRYNIEVGSTLSANDHLTDPFDNSTVLIVSANPEEGFKGLIINKPMNWNIFKPDALVDSVKAAPISYGGPVAVQGFPLVSLSNKVTDGYVKVIDGVYFGDTMATNLVFKRIYNVTEQVDGFWFFFGFSSWLYEQLFDELDQGAWQLSESTIERLDWPEVI